jgi:hypothetical protein
MMLKSLAVFAVMPLLLFGPPRIAVTTTDLPAGVVAIVEARYHVPEADARVYATAYRNVGNRREEREVRLTRIDAEHYRLERTWGSWPAAVVVGVEQGEHGKHGVAEALVLVDATGKAVRADIAKSKPIFGNPMPRRVNDNEIEEGFKQVGSR